MALGASAQRRLAVVLETMLGETPEISRDVAAFFDQYLAGVPFLAALGLNVMVRALLWLPFLFIGIPKNAAALTTAQRERYMGKWTHARLYFVREGFFLVKAVALFGWGAHPAIRRRFAMPPAAVTHPVTLVHPPRARSRAGGSLVRRTLSCDFVVIGSGAGGATAAKVLSEAGRDVVILEEGPEVRDEDRGQGTNEAFFRLFRDRGTQVAMGRSVIPVLQGRCVGGTTVVNGAIVWRMPEDAYERCFGPIGAKDAIPLRELEARYDRIEKDLHVATTPDDLLGENGRLMRKGAQALGYQGHSIRRNVVDCQGSSRCLEACPTQRKQSMERTYIPAAVAKGARLLAEHEVETIEVRGDRATAVLGRTANGDSFRVEARRGVVLAASAIQSPCILQRSGLGPKKHVGRHFRGHPGTAVSGVYKDPVRIWIGGTQTYEIDHFRHDGFKMEVTSLPLELAGVRMHGFGATFQKKISDFPNTAVWGVQVRSDAEGTVDLPLFAKLGTRITFTPTARDMAIFQRGVKTLASLHFAAGAVRVYPGVHGAPEVLESPDDLAKLDALSADPQDYSMILSHLFGTCRMSKDAKDGVVGTDFAVHGVKGLWVVDASVFSATPGVNPQHTIMALSMLASERIADAPSS